MSDIADIETTWTPSFCLVNPISEAGIEWCEQNINDLIDPRNRMIPVEHKYFPDIVLGARADGLTVVTTN